MVYPNTKKGSLLGETDLKFLQDIIVASEKANNKAGRSEIIELIGKIAQCSDLIKCRNHWNYLVISGKLKELKGGFRLRKAQNTTTKRTQITVDKQLWWQTTLDSDIYELKNLNHPNDKFMNVIEYFIGKLDDYCLISVNENIYVVESSRNNKTEKISDDFWGSITTVQTGFASVQQE